MFCKEFWLIQGMVPAWFPVFPLQETLCFQSGGITMLWWQLHLRTITLQIIIVIKLPYFGSERQSWRRVSYFWVNSWCQTFKWSWLGSVLIKSQNQFPSKKLCAPRYPWKPKETVTQGSPFEIKQELNALLQAETIWLHSTHLSTKAVNLTARLHLVTGDWALHKWQKLPVAGWKGKPWSRTYYFLLIFAW